MPVRVYGESQILAVFYLHLHQMITIEHAINLKIKDISTQASVLCAVLTNNNASCVYTMVYNGGTPYTC